MNRKVLINKSKLMKSAIRKTMHKHGKSWIISSLLLLAMAGGIAVAGHADANSPKSTNNPLPQTRLNSQTHQTVNVGASSNKQNLDKSNSQDIIDQAKTLHSNILRNSSNQKNLTSSQNVSTDQSNQQSSQSNKHSENTVYNKYIQIDTKDINGNILKSPHYHSDGRNNWYPDSNFEGVDVSNPISLSSMIPSGYCYIYKPNYNPNDGATNYNSSYLTVNGKLPTNWNGHTESSNGVSWQPSDNQIAISNSSAFNSTNPGEVSLYVYPILLTQGHVKVRVVRHYFNGSSDVHWVNLPSGDSAVTDGPVGPVQSNFQNTSFFHRNIMYNVSDTRPESNTNSEVQNLHRGDNMPKGDGYYGDIYTYTLPSNWQSLDRSGINYDNYLKGFSASDHNSNTLGGTFQDGNGANQGAQATLSNGILTLNYNQDSALNLNINYYDNNTDIKNANKSIRSIRTVNLKYNQNDKPTEVDILTLPTDLSGNYRYSGKYGIDNGGTVNYKDPSHSIISYMMNDSVRRNRPQSINIYLTRRGTIYIKYVNSKTGKTISVQNAGYEPDGTPFDYREFEGKEYLPIGYELDNHAEDSWNLNPVNYSYYTNYDQNDIVYVKPLSLYPSYRSQITVKYIDTDNHDRIIAIKTAGRKSDGSPFNIEPYEEELPENYQLDNDAYDDWNLNPVHYPYYINQDQIDNIYVKHQMTPISRHVTNTLTVNYQDQNGNSISGVPSKTEQVTYTQSGVKDKVTGQISYSGSWKVTDGGWPSITSPDLISRGYGKPDKAVINDVPSYNSGNKTETVIYHRIPAHNNPVRPRDKTSSVNQSVTYTLTINYRNQYGNLIPGVAPKSQSVNYTEYGTKDDKTGAITWYNDWAKHRSGEWSPVLSPDLTSLGYGKPSRQIVNDVTPNYGGSNKIENVYYSKDVQHHSQVPSTPITPVPEPDNPVTPPSNPIIPQPNNPQSPNKPSRVRPNNVQGRPKPVLKHDVFEFRQGNPGHSRLIKRFGMSGQAGTKINVAKMVPNNYKINSNTIFAFDGKTHVIYLKLDVVSKTNNSYRPVRPIKKAPASIKQSSHQAVYSKASPTKLPQTGETTNHAKTASVVLTGLAMIIASFGKAIDRRKHD